MGNSYPGLPTGIGTYPLAIFIQATSVASVAGFFNSMSDAWPVRLTVPGCSPICLFNYVPSSTRQPRVKHLLALYQAISVPG